MQKIKRPYKDEETQTRLQEKCDELNLNDEMRDRLWFMTYDDPSFIDAFLEADDDNIPHLLRALDFDIKTYSLVEYHNSRAANEYVPPYDDRITGVIRLYEMRSPAERARIEADCEAFDRVCLVETNNWYKN